MPSGEEVTGLDDLVRVARALRAAGDGGKGLRRELAAGLNRASKKAREDMNAAIPESFPSSGGLAGLMAARSKFAVSTRTGARTTSVRLVGRGKSRGALSSALNRGVIHHPVYGRPESWVAQSAGIRQDLVEQAFDQEKPALVTEVIRAIDNVRDQIYRS